MRPQKSRPVCGPTPQGTPACAGPPCLRGPRPLVPHGPPGAAEGRSACPGAAGPPGPPAAAPSLPPRLAPGLGPTSARVWVPASPSTSTRFPQAPPNKGSDGDPGGCCQGCLGSQWPQPADWQLLTLSLPLSYWRACLFCAILNCSWPEY